MASISVLEARNMIPVSTAVNTVMNGHTIKIVNFATAVSLPDDHTLGLEASSSPPIASEGLVSSSSGSAATASMSFRSAINTTATTSQEMQHISTIVLQEFISSEKSVLLSSIESGGLIESSHSAATAVSASAATSNHGVNPLTTNSSSVRRVGPELVPTAATEPLTPTPTSTVTSFTTAISTPSAAGSVSINVSNTLNPSGSSTASTNPTVIVGIVLVTIIAMVLITFFVRRRRSQSHHTTPAPIPLRTIIPDTQHTVRPAGSSSSELQPREYSAPKRVHDGDEAAPQRLPKRRRLSAGLSGDTFVEEKKRNLKRMHDGDEAAPQRLPKRRRLSGESFVEEERSGHII